MLRKFRQFFVTTLIGGVVVILPITIFIAAIRFLFNLISRFIEPVRNILSFNSITNQFIIDALTYGVVIIALFLLGLLVQTQFGSRFYRMIENEWLSKLPFYSTIKETVNQFLGENAMGSFSKVVLVDPFNSGAKMVGFIADEYEETGNYVIFVPTGPNPTNGFVFHVKKDLVEHTDVKPEDAMRSIIGVGTGSNEIFKF